MRELAKMVKRQREISFINDCNAIVDYNELEKAVIWYSKSPVISQKHIFMQGNYPAVSILGEKIHIHRLLMMFWLNSYIPNCYIVHHVDGNKLNVNKENLCLMFISTHQSLHNQGKTISDEQRKKLLEYNHSRKGKRRKYKRDISSKQVYDLKIQGYSFNKISKMLGLDWGCVKQRYEDYLIHNNPELIGDKNG